MPVSLGFLLAPAPLRKNTVEEKGVRGVWITQNRTEIRINTAQNNIKKIANLNEITGKFLNAASRLVLENCNTVDYE